VQGCWWFSLQGVLSQQPWLEAFTIYFIAFLHGFKNLFFPTFTRFSSGKQKRNFHMRPCLELYVLLLEIWLNRRAIPVWTHSDNTWTFNIKTSRRPQRRTNINHRKVKTFLLHELTRSGRELKFKAKQSCPSLYFDARIKLILTETQCQNLITFFCLPHLTFEENWLRL